MQPTKRLVLTRRQAQPHINKIISDHRNTKKSKRSHKDQNIFSPARLCYCVLKRFVWSPLLATGVKKKSKLWLLCWLTWSWVEPVMDCGSCPTVRKLWKRCLGCGHFAFQAAGSTYGTWLTEWDNKQRNWKERLERLQNLKAYSFSVHSYCCVLNFRQFLIQCS